MKVLRLVSVEPVRFLFTMALAIQSMATTSLVHRKVCLMSKLNDTVCSFDHGPGIDAFDGGTVWDAAMAWCFYLDACANILGALVSCVYGPASDKFGRRGLLILPPLGMILGSVSYLIQVYYLHLPVHYLLISSALMGFSGYYQATYIATMSYICDITDHSDRSLRLGLMESCGLIGGPIGLLLATALLHLHLNALLFIIIILVQVLILLFVSFWLDESVFMKTPLEENLQGGRCTPQSICSDVSWNLKRTLMVYVVWRTENRRQLLLINQTVGILSSLGSSGESDLTLLYTSRPPLSWGPLTMLAYSATKSVIQGVALVVGMPILFAYLGHWTVRLDMVVAMTTLLSTSASLVLMACSYTTLMMMLVPVVGCLGGFPNTLISSIKCKLVEPNEFGALFACTVLIQTVCRVIGRVMFQKLYAATLSIWPRLPFLAMGVFFVMLLSIITYMWCLSGHLDKTDKGSVRKRLIEAHNEKEEEEIGLFTK